MTSITQETITADVLALRDEYVENGSDGFQEINCGECEDFARDLVSQLHKRGIIDSYDISVSELLTDAYDGDDNNYGYPFNRETLDTVYPGFEPPAGISFDEIDDISAYSNFSTGTHIWTISAGRNYDAEAPGGVDNFLDLPFFQRIIQRWDHEGRPGPSKGSVLKM